MVNKIILKRNPLDYMRREAYRVLRTNLQFCGTDKKIIALTSCMMNEGKSTVSLNLALSLAEAGKKTLLIDTDMRNSVLEEETKGQEQALLGLSHYLSGQSGLQEVICTTDVQNLNIIFAGTFPPNPAELLSGSRFFEMLQALRKVCDYIIIDTPPVGSIIDGAIVAGQSDGVILLIESGAVSYKLAQSAKEQLERSGCVILGAVLNKVDVQSAPYGKYYGSYGAYQETFRR